jgi:hypothetical protein
MAESRIINLPYNTTPLASDIFPVVSLSSGSTNQISLSGAMLAANILTLKAANYIYVTISNNASANGINLLNTYTTAKTLTPCGSALSTTNRVSIILPPATYNLQTSALSLNTQYIDIVGLTKEASHVVLTSTNATATVIQTANDVRCIGLTINDTGAGYGWAPSSNLSLTYWENIIFGSINASNLSGTFKNCTGSNNALNDGGFVRISGTISGTFTNCTGSNTGGSGGGFVGRGGTASGRFINCIGSNTGANGGGGFAGAYGTASGTFNNCIGLNTGGGAGGFVGTVGTASGTFTNCKGSNTSSSNDSGGFAGYQGIASGTFYNCTGSNTSTEGGGFAGRNGSASGAFYNCIGSNTALSGSGFAGSTGTVSGRFINCIGSNTGANGGGFVGPNGISSGTFTNCTSTDLTLPALTNSGDVSKPACYINCLDGSGRLVNGSA